MCNVAAPVLVGWSCFSGWTRRSFWLGDSRLQAPLRDISTDVVATRGVGAGGAFGSVPQTPGVERITALSQHEWWCLSPRFTPCLAMWFVGP